LKLPSLLRLRALSLLLAVGCQRSEPVVVPVDPPASSSPRTESAPTYAAVLAALDDRIASARSQAAAMPKDWSRAARLSALLQQRFRLTSDIADLLDADAVVTEAFALTVPGGGPWAARAALSATLHDLATAEDAHQRLVDRPLQSAADKATALRGLAQVALARGQVELARTHLSAARSLSDDFSQACAEARLAELTQGVEAADRHFASASERLVRATGEAPAWLALQRARLALARGALPEAEDHLNVARAALPGWWAIDAFAADLAFARGDTAAARAALEAAAEGTPHPEYAARLAIVVAETDLFAAEEMMSLARLRMSEWLARAPSAMATHAAQLALAEGDADRGLDLAREHARTHSDVDALVLLARAATLAGEPAVAAEAMARVAAGPWDADYVAGLCAVGGCPHR